MQRTVQTGIACGTLDSIKTPSAIETEPIVVVKSQEGKPGAPQSDQLPTDIVTDAEIVPVDGIHGLRLKPGINQNNIEFFS